MLSVAEVMNIIEGIDVHRAVYHQHYHAGDKGGPAKESRVQKETLTPLL